jgi:hypothetical protein
MSPPKRPRDGVHHDYKYRSHKKKKGNTSTAAFTSSTVPRPGIVAGQGRGRAIMRDR